MDNQSLADILLPLLNLALLAGLIVYCFCLKLSVIAREATIKEASNMLNELGPNIDGLRSLLESRERLIVNLIGVIERNRKYKIIHPFHMGELVKIRGRITEGNGNCFLGIVKDNVVSIKGESNE